MAFSNNPMFTPDNLLMLSGNLLSNPNFGEGLGAGLSQLGANVAAQRKEQEERQRQLQETAQMGNYLRQQAPGQDFSNFTPGMMKLAASSALDQQLNPGSDLISVGDGIVFDKRTRKYITPPPGTMPTSSDLGLQLQYGVDADGNPVPMQVSKDGRLVQSKLPDGVRLSKEPIKLDAGTHFVLVDPITRQPISTIPKDIAGAEEQKLSAKNKVDAQAQLSTVKRMAQDVDAAVKDLIGDEKTGQKPDPGLSRVTGSFDGGWGSWMPNFTDDANRAQTKIDYLKGTAFIQGREFLKGQGQITDFESRKAEAAFSKMNQAQNEADFTKAVQDFNDAVQAGVRKVEAAANGNWQGDGTTTAPVADPKVDSLVEQYRSKGK